MNVTGIAFLLFFFAGLGLALFRQPIYGLFTYIAEFYIHPPSRWWGESLPDLRWSFLAAFVTLLAIVIRLPPERGRQAWIQTTPAKIMIAFAIWFWIGSLWALDPELHVSAAVLITKYVLVFFMVYRLIDTPAKLNGFLLAHVAGCLYLGWLAFNIGAQNGRLDGVGGPGIDDSNTLGMQLATAVVVAAMVMLQSKGWRFALCVVSIAFSLNALVLTGTRGGALALLASGATLWYVKPNAHRRAFYMYAAFGILMIGYVGSERFWDRMQSTKAAASGNKEEMDFSAYARIAMFNAQIQMAKDYPLGSGHRGSEILSKTYLDEGTKGEQGARSSHNAFMTVLVEQGIPGTILSLLLIGWTANALRKLAKFSRTSDQVERALYGAAIGGALTVVMVGGFFADFSKAEVQIWMLAMLAALIQPKMFSAEISAGESTKLPPVDAPAPLPTVRSGSLNT